MGIEFEQALSRNWDPSFHETGKPIIPNALKYGFMILDWDSNFKKRLLNYRTQDLRIPFQYIDKIPDWQKEANYNEVGEIMGRFAPINVYSNSGPQPFEIVLNYVAESRNTSATNSSVWSLEYIEELIIKIKSLVFPIQEGGFSPPPKVICNIGNHYFDLPLIIRSVQVENAEPIDVITGLSMRRMVTISATVDYPLWQGIDGIKVYTAYEGQAGSNRWGNEVFAYEALEQQYRPPRRRTGNNGMNSPFGFYS